MRFNITVPPGRLWVMGDNRADSDDSRYRVNDPGGGTIPESAVVGRAFLIIWPLSRISDLPIPNTFEQAGLARGGRGRRRPARDRGRRRRARGRGGPHLASAAASSGRRPDADGPRGRAPENWCAGHCGQGQPLAAIGAAEGTIRSQ